jgi:hypothetical protein
MLWQMLLLPLLPPRLLEFVKAQITLQMALRICKPSKDLEVEHPEVETGNPWCGL